jgi:HlyD family secretion protein
VSTPLTFRNAHPDQLDRMVRVASPAGWAVLGVLVAVILGGLIWSIVSTAPVKVAGKGVLLANGGLSELSAPAAGRLADLNVRVGDRVQAGELLARISQPALQARVDNLRQQAADLDGQRARLAALREKERTVRARADVGRGTGLQQTLAALQDRERALAAKLADMRALEAKGFVSRDRVLALETDLADTRQRIATTRDALGGIVVESDERLVQVERELFEADQRMANARQDLAAAEAELAVSGEVRAQSAGRVVEVSARPGEQLAPGAPLLRTIDAAGQGLTALLYVPPGEGKKVRPGMPVQVVPSTVRREREGYIQARVISVSEIPATRQAMVGMLKNADLVQSMMDQGAPFEVRVRLIRDPRTVSGFAWSTDLGAARAVEDGTVISGQVVVERIRLVGLVFPKVDVFLHWLGLDAAQ